MPARLSDKEYEEYNPLLRRLTSNFIKRLPPQVLFDDLLAIAWAGFLEAYNRRTDEMTQEHVIAFGLRRARGAILDYLRAQDPLPRRLRATMRLHLRAAAYLRNQLQREPVAEEVAEHLGVTLETYETQRRDVYPAEMLNVERAHEVPESSPPPDALADHRAVLELISRLGGKLPARLLLILKYYYEDERTMRSISDELHITESRVCQLHGEAIERLQSLLRSEKGERFRSRSKLRPKQ